MNLPSWHQHNENKWPYRQTPVSWKASSELNTIQKRDFSNVTPLPNYNLTTAVETQLPRCHKSPGDIGKVIHFAVSLAVSKLQEDRRAPSAVEVAKHGSLGELSPKHVSTSSLAPRQKGAETPL